MANEFAVETTLRSDHEHEHEYEHEAVTQARQRLEVQRILHGENHPDFATGLNHLALLLIMHGAPEEAEPLLHQALAIRKVVLGEDHPDYATCLSSLGGLLWARGDLEEAEPLLHQAHDIRCRVLGADHPRSLASQSCLEQFVRMKDEPRDNGQDLETTHAPTGPEVLRAVAAPSDSLEDFQPLQEAPGSFEDLGHPPRGVAAPAEWQGTEPNAGLTAEAEEHAPPVRYDLGSHTMSICRNDLLHELAVLTDVFTDLSERLMEAVLQLNTPGLPPSDALVAELASCQREYANLRDQTLMLGQTLEVACPPVEHLANLEDLTTLLDKIAEAELRPAKSEETRRRGLSVLNRVLALAHASDAGFSPLHACHETARALQEAIASSASNALPDETETLAQAHALAHLLTLVEDGDQLSDDVWADHYESVALAFGKPLAAAAARAQLVLPFEHVGAHSEEQELS